MIIVDDLKALNKTQRAAFVASFLGWALDAFDYFLLTFILKDIAAEFHVETEAMTMAITLTLVARPVGAFVFGRLADRFGRRPVLMFDVALYSVLAAASAFAPNLMTLFVLRCLFGFAMGGEWGIGASLAMESIPPKARGVVSGLLQSGYPVGFFLGALVNWLLVDHIGWRGLFIVGAFLGGLIFGSLSQKIGRRRAIVMAALLALPIIPLWAFSATPLLLGLGAFLIQIAVQGAWGVVPAHLNELSPPEARGAFPGFVYQIGNLIAASNATIQGEIARRTDHNYALALASTVAVVAVVLSLVTWFGPEAKGVEFAKGGGG